MGSLTIGVTIGYIQQLGTIGGLQLSFPEQFRGMYGAPQDWCTGASGAEAPSTVFLCISEWVQ